jgi:hypothetical protein
MKTLEEKNRMIAKFMGFEDESKFVGGNAVMRKKTVWKYGCQQYEEYSYRDLKYHTSWDWLMPVVEEIDHHEFESELLDNIEIAIKTRQIEAVHDAVIKFIEKHGNNN